MHRYHVYIMASRSRRLYAGVTAALERRVLQHTRGEATFTAKYRMTRLVLVEAANPLWMDLADAWGAGAPGPHQQVPPPSSARRANSGSG